MIRRAGAGALAAGLCLAATAGAAGAAGCREIEHAGAPYTVCEAAPGRDMLRTWLLDAAGAPYAGFGRLAAALAAEGQALVFAMNAGMYDDGLRPVGLYVENGRELTPATLGGGYGNFGMRPNGVFCLLDDRAAVVESAAFMADPLPCRFATQSGPMLVIGGALHPRFREGSDSRFLRNGVGVADGGRRVVFAISGRPVNFHDFARLFRDGLGVADALFLDGNVSKLHAPALGRSDAGRAIGPIVGVVRPAG